MFGWKFVKFEPNQFVIVIKNGKVKKQGNGLSFWFYKLNTSIEVIPIETKNIPFIFEELSSDYQTITIQGDLIYRISDGFKIKEQVNFAIDTSNKNYISDDPKKLEQRIINIIRTLTKSAIAQMTLRDTIRSADNISQTLKLAVQNNEFLGELGIKVTNISILSILPNKETARALEAETRENMLREADDAVYKRRNSSVEQERTIKENELNTEIAVEEKKRQIMETQVEGQRSLKEKERVIMQEDLVFQIKQEQENTKLVELSIKNQKSEAEVKAYSLQVLLKTFEQVNPEVIRALASIGMDSEQLIANAFTNLASNANRIGELSITPELLQSLFKRKYE